MESREEFLKRIKVDVNKDKKDPIKVFEHINSGEKVAKLRTIKLIEEEIAYVQGNDSFTPAEKAGQVTVLMNVIKFIKNYDRACKVLNVDTYEHRFDEVER